MIDLYGLTHQSGCFYYVCRAIVHSPHAGNHKTDKPNCTNVSPGCNFGSPGCNFGCSEKANHKVDKPDLQFLVSRHKPDKTGQTRFAIFGVPTQTEKNGQTELHKRVPRAQFRVPGVQFLMFRQKKKQNRALRRRPVVDLRAAEPSDPRRSWERFAAAPATRVASPGRPFGC